MPNEVRTIAIFAVILSYYLSDIQLMRQYDPQRLDKRSARSWSYTAFSLSLAGLLLLQPVLFPNWGLSFSGDWALFLTGLTLSLAGLFLNRWGRIHLGKYFIESTEIQADHRLVETGPYRFVRHPIYVSILMVMAGLLLINPSILMLIVCIYAYSDFLMAARRDEKLLKEKLPGYAAYMARTPRFFPRINF